MMTSAFLFLDAYRHAYMIAEGAINLNLQQIELSGFGSLLKQVWVSVSLRDNQATFQPSSLPPN
jgi:hypothetical protein